MLLPLRQPCYPPWLHRILTVQRFCFLDHKMVGPLLSRPAKPLPDDLEEFARGSGDDGVILVSFGSILDEIDDQIIATMAAVFSSLPQRVIWKLNAGASGKNPFRSISW